MHLCCTWTFSTCRDRGLLSSWGAWVSQGDGFSFFRAWPLGCLGLHSCGLGALEHTVRSFCSVRALWLRHLVLVSSRHVESSWPRDRTHIPALTGKFLSTVPPECPLHSFFSSCNFLLPASLGEGECEPERNKSHGEWVTVD